jgi:hypothetical protein
MEEWMNEWNKFIHFPKRNGLILHAGQRLQSGAWMDKLDKLLVILADEMIIGIFLKFEEHVMELRRLI